MFFLVGFMGAGKSYTGNLLAEVLGYDFLDLDAYIEQVTGRTIASIFEEYGEPTFRQVEQEALKSIEGLENTVVATGGGTPCFFDNMEWMKAKGTTIYLKASPQLLAARLQGEKAHRPLIAKLGEEELLRFIEGKLKERAFFYEKAEFVFDQDSNENILDFYERVSG